MKGIGARAVVVALVMSALVAAAALSSHPALGAAPVDKTKIDDALRGFIDSRALVGVSALIYQDGHETYFGAFGQADRYVCERKIERAWLRSTSATRMARCRACRM